jgi:hypothetical protein
VADGAPRVGDCAIGLDLLEGRVENVLGESIAEQLQRDVAFRGIAVDQEVSVGQRPCLVKVGRRARGLERVHQIAVEITDVHTDTARNSEVFLAAV